MRPPAILLFAAFSNVEIEHLNGLGSDIMTSDIIYVIPSYKRPNILRDKTLTMLFRYGVLPHDIYVFIADTLEEKESYSYLRQEGVHIRYGPIGLCNMRNHIVATFPPETCMVCIDDDISELVYMKEDTTFENKKSAQRYPLLPYPAHHFGEWMKHTFQFMKKHNIHLFGIYPVKNGYFMKSLDSVTTDLKFCVGAFWGCILDPNIILTLEEKEDVQRTLLNFQKYGKVLRYNHVAPVTTYYKTKGGMQALGTDRHSAARESARQLVATFPDLCKIYEGKKSGVMEVRLRKMTTDDSLKDKICCLHWLP